MKNSIQQSFGRFFAAKAKTGFFQADQTRRKWFYCLNHHAQGLHDLSVADIETRDVYSILEVVWMTKIETVGRTRLYIEAVLSWAKQWDCEKIPPPQLGAAAWISF